MICLAGLLVGCKSDPYPEDVEFESLENSKKRREKMLQKTNHVYCGTTLYAICRGRRGGL